MVVSMKHIAQVFLFLIFLLPALSTAEQTANGRSPDLVIHLLDYLAKDYAGAVQNGKILSRSEYDEQVEFSDLVQTNAKGVEKLDSNAEFMSGVGRLKELILSKGDADTVSEIARQLQRDAIRLSEVEVAPSSWPDLATGAALYQKNCVSCHGVQGKGDGVAGVGLDPRPANFHDPDLVWNSSPYKFYNTIRLGVPGTGMASFQNLSDKEVWALAFFLKSLPYQATVANGASKFDLSLKEVATLTDSDIANLAGNKSEETAAVIGALRTKSGNLMNEDPLGIAERLLDESLEAAKINDFSSAGKLALRAYLEGIEPIEPKMKANVPGLVEQVESLMSEYRISIANRDSISKIQGKKTEIVAKLKEVRSLFSQNKMSPGVAFGAAFSIFLREGFEAVLIIIILISILKAMGQPQAIKWVHVGWSSALVVGIMAWFASGLLLSMSGLSRELLEGSISLLAVAVLIYVGFWLHRYAEMKKWRAFLEEKLKHGLTKGSYFALAVVAFMAVFREAFEVVLFLRAIWIDLDHSGQTVAGAGILSSLFLLLVLSYYAVKESKKLPLGILFQVCSWTMMVLAIVLIGKGLHSFQEAGLIGVNSLNVPLRIDILGIYPSSQTIGAQLFLVALFAALLFRDQKKALSS